MTNVFVSANAAERRSANQCALCNRINGCVCLNNPVDCFEPLLSVDEVMRIAVCVHFLFLFLFFLQKTRQIEQNKTKKRNTNYPVCA
jgi:hypothetical protein